MHFISVAFVLGVLHQVAAAPAPLFGINLGTGSSSDATPTPVSQDDITNNLLRPALFSRAVYCSTEAVEKWACGDSCDALPNVKVLAAGGDDGLIPRFLVAHDADEDTIVVAHQGTDPKNFLSDLNDLKFAQVGANKTVLPAAGDDIKMHDGFAYAQSRTADIVLSTVQSALESTGSKKILVTGHSLGAAIASIDAMMLKTRLDQNLSLSAVVFGLPRVGNQAWADFVDQTLGSSFTHVTNQNDPVPRVPPQSLQFQHPSNEIHITSVDSAGNIATAESCPGQENSHCSDGFDILDFSIDNHRGPYFHNVSMGNKFCTL
ncbi:alpha/beta-hydrolase [Trametes coccinea BRFM310]|uniref:Alpha/beta-hydrolase n=1 Tax=Trametes coccinea (strain BRFM310) TaxID=1353009 RepID=A0A1Y2ITE2_TRAC3|nr:alpha/beta-hydrolase [Trametes coccinea BRFM310]